MGRRQAFSSPDWWFQSQSPWFGKSWSWKLRRLKNRRTSDLPQVACFAVGIHISFLGFKHRWHQQGGWLYLRTREELESSTERSQLYSRKLRETSHSEPELRQLLSQVSSVTFKVYRLQCSMYLFQLCFNILESSRSRALRLILRPLLQLRPR